jgi:hypothetical protein
LAKVTPEFKRAFKHYVDGAGRLGLLSELDVINMQSVISPFEADGIGGLPYYDDDYWADEYSQFDVVRAFRKAFDYVYVRDIELLRAHGQAITVDAVRRLLDKYATIMNGELDTNGIHGLLMTPPALREELARSDAERQAIREAKAAHWHHAAAELLKLLGNVDENEYIDLTLHRLSDWTESACAYWATQQALHGRQPAEGEARKLYKAYDKVLFEDRSQWETKHGLNYEFTPYESLQDAMTAFCAAYSHGIDPYTGERPTLRDIA